MSGLFRGIRYGLERIVCIGACAGVLLLPGCETTDSDNALMASTIFKGAAITANDPRKVAGFALLGDLYGAGAGIQGQKEASKQVADAIRERNAYPRIETSDEIEARVTREFYAKQQREQMDKEAIATEGKNFAGGDRRYSTAFYSKKDINGDGLIVPSELRGATKEVFPQRDFFIGSEILDEEDRFIHFEIYCSRTGERIMKTESILLRRGIGPQFVEARVYAQSLIARGIREGDTLLVSLMDKNSEVLDSYSLKIKGD